jgi:hypothetical protein
MRPRFAAVSQAYPRKTKYDNAALLRLIGRDDLVDNFNFANDCAIRVSVALVGAGMRIPGGRLSFTAGPHKGLHIETGQARLSYILKQRNMLGEPEKYEGRPAAENGIGARHGVISFWRLHPTWVGDNQGHIDIVEPGEGGWYQCGGACYFGAARVWFWPLK